MTTGDRFKVARRPSRPLIYIVGALPPPIGGISMHLDRFLRTDEARNFDIVIFGVSGIKKEPMRYGVRIYSGHRVFVAIKFLVSLVRRPPAVLHFHFSQFGRARPLFPILKLLAAQIPTIVTIHSGTFVESVGSLSRSERDGITRFLQRMAAVIVVNRAQERYLTLQMGLRRTSVHVIKPYIPPSNGPGLATGREGTNEIRIAASGYGTPLYGWHILLDAVKRQAGKRRWSFFFYTEYQQPYFSEIVRRIAAEMPDAKIYKDMKEADFLEKLASHHCFVRPTLADGDSLVVREALGLGLKVIASDASPRPQGCRLFKAGSAEALADALGRTDRDDGDTTAEKFDSARELADIYAAAAGAGV